MGRPTIPQTSGVGNASTWIGVVNPDNGAFIQVGTIEDVLSANRPSYFVFWSDTRLKFLAHYIANVRPGQTITAEMSQTPKGWDISTSIDSGRAESFQSHYGKGQKFGQSQWLQEDPLVTIKSSSFLPYPEMSDVQFKALQLNRRRPLVAHASAQLMATPHAQLVPSRVSDDSFTLMPPTAIQAQFLNDLSSFNASLGQYYSSVESVSGPLTVSQRLNTIALALAIGNDQKALTAQQWPAAAGPGIDDFVRNYGAFVDDLQYMLSSSSPENFVGPLRLLLGSLSNDDSQVETSIGLPPS